MVAVYALLPDLMELSIADNIKYQTKMENKKIKKETIMKRVKEVLQIVSVPAAIIISAFIIKKQMEKPSIRFCFNTYDDDDYFFE